MNIKNNRLLVRQLDKKLKAFKIAAVLPPGTGWMHTLRTTLNLSYAQLGKRMKISPSAVQGMERREASGGVTLNTLKEFAEALDLQLVYGFIPKEESFEKMIERKAEQAAFKIVQRANTSMRLEDQENAPERIKEAIQELTEDITKEMPKFLWD